MSAQHRWRGLKDLVQDAIEHGSSAIEQVHRATANRPFDILEQIPAVATPTRVVRALHDVSVTTVYGAIRLGNRAVGRVLDVALPPAADHAETEADQVGNRTDSSP